MIDVLYTLPSISLPLPRRWHHVSWLRWGSFVIGYVLYGPPHRCISCKKVLNALTACDRLLFVMAVWGQLQYTVPRQYMPHNTKYFTLKLRTSHHSGRGVSERVTAIDHRHAWPTLGQGVSSSSPLTTTRPPLSLSIQSSLVSSRPMSKLYYCARQVKLEIVVTVRQKPRTPQKPCCDYMLNLSRMQ